MEASGVEGEEPEKGGGGSLSRLMCKEVGSVQVETQGLLAWALVKALFSTRMIITQMSV